METAAITMEPEPRGTREVAARKLLTGRDMDEIPAKASLERALAQALGPTDVLDVEDVDGVPTALWTVQHHAASMFPGMSLYALN